MNPSTVLMRLLLFVAAMSSLPLIAQTDTIRRDSLLALPDDTTKVKLLIAYARDEERQDYNRARTAFRLATRLANRVGTARQRATLDYANGNLLVHAGEPDSATVLLDRALAYYETTDDVPSQVTVLTSLSNIDVGRKNVDRALTRAQRAKDLAVTTGDPQSMALAISYLGNVWLGMRDNEKAMSYFTEALEVARANQLDVEIADMAFMIGDDHYRFNRLAEAVPLLRESQAAAQRLGDKGKERSALGPLASTYMLLDDYDRSMATYDSIIQLSGGVVYAGTLANRSLLYQRMGRNEEAEADLQEALGRVRRANRPKTLQQYLRLTENFYANIGSYDSAYHYQSQRMVHNDSAYSIQLNSTVVEMDTKYATAEKEALITVQEGEIKQQRTFLYAVLAVLLLALAAGVIFYTLSRRLRRRNTENEKLVAEKETLIGEIHHRVKNNLQVISSLLQLQSRGLKADDHQARDALRESQSRVQAMGLIHQKLYQGEEVTSVSMPEYLNDLGETLLDAYRLDDRVEIFYDVEDLDLDVDTAIPLGLIINELVTNALKYAFPGEREGTIEIALHRDGDRSVLRVTDDGVGATGPDVSAGGTGFGTNLVELLSQQLKGKKRTLDGKGYGTEIVFSES